MEFRTKLRIGIDFGTSFSAVAYTYNEWTAGQIATVHTPEQNLLSKLQTVRFNGADQVRTQIGWHKGRQEYSWGWQLDKDILNEEIMEDDRITMLKLGLDASAATEQIRKSQQEKLLRIPSQPRIQDLIGTYLQKLFLYAKARILERWGTGKTYNIFDGALVECIICVPALWTPEMNEVMIEAAITAGIPNPDLVSEPEAAAALIIQDQSGRPRAVASQADGQQENLIIDFNDSFLVADVGGGTGDFITYVVETQTPILKIKEGTRGTGGLCGSEFLNLHFRDIFASYIDRWFEGLLEDWRQLYTEGTRERFLDTAVKDFDEEKKEFDGFSERLEDMTMSIHISGVRENMSRNTKPGRIMVPTTYIKKAFWGILEPIIQAMEQQIVTFNNKCSGPERWVKNIFFVGGLSASPYALRILRKTFSEVMDGSLLMGYPIEIITPSESPSTVVAKGAVLRATHKDLIGERYLRRSIGIGWDEAFDSNKHKENDKSIDIHDGAEVVEDCIHWLFRVDEAVQRGEVRKLRGWRCFSPRGPFKLTETLYGSKVEKENHLRINDPINDIEAIGEIDVDLLDAELAQKLNRSSFRRIRHPVTGRESLMIDYEVRISFDYPRLTYEIIIPSNGKFPVTGKGWGSNPIRVPATVNCAAVLEIVGQGVGQKLMPVNHTTRSPSPDGSSLPVIQTNPSENLGVERQLQQPCQICRGRGINCIRPFTHRKCVRCRKQRLVCKM